MLRIHHPTERQVHQQHTERDRQQQQGLKLFFDRQVHQHAGDGNHNQVFPAAVLEVHQPGKPRLLPQLLDRGPQFSHTLLSFPLVSHQNGRVLSASPAAAQADRSPPARRTLRTAYRLPSGAIQATAAAIAATTSSLIPLCT